METIQFTVHEFVTVMGILNERVRDGEGVPASSVWHAWKARYDKVDRELERLDMMDRADMLFDERVTFDNVTKDQLAEVLEIVAQHAAHEQKLIDENDLDADPDERDIWKTLHARLETSLGWSD